MLEPEVLEFAYKNCFVLLTHDECITKCVTNHINKGEEHCGVIIGSNRFQGAQSVEEIITQIVKFDAGIKQALKILQLKYLQW